MGDQNYEIASLKGSDNYDCWLKNIRGIFALDYYCFIRIGKKITLKILRAFSEEKLASTGDNEMSIEVIVNTELAKNMYETKMKMYKKKLLDYNHKYF